MSIRDVLAENFESLRNAGKRLYSLPDITKAGGGSNGTLGRILKKDSGATIDTVEQLARTYRLETWQLLVPGLDPKAPPVIQGKAGEWPFVHFSRHDYDTYLTEQERKDTEALLLGKITMAKHAAQKKNGTA